MDTAAAGAASQVVVNRLLFALVAVALAAGVHFGLRRTGRRLPLWFARRLGAGGVPGDGARVPWRWTMAIAFLAAKVAVWSAAAVVLSEQFPLLHRARDLVLWTVLMGLTGPLFTLNQTAYSVLDVVELLALLGGLWVVVGGLTRVVRTQVIDAGGGARGGKESVLTLLRYLLVFVGAIIVLQGWGVDVTLLTIAASVLGVGIGFGLQNIANNFVSGLLMNFERPIQPGDFVQVGALAGTVERIGARSTEIRTLDRVTILVPNSRLLEHEVVNWSHGDPVSRLHIPVGVAYGTTLARVRGALLEAAEHHPQVLRDPRPTVEFLAWGDSALQLELLVWIREPRLQGGIRSDLHFLVEAQLRRAGIEVPFPQRDLRLRSPQLERLVTAWGRRHFTAEELAPEETTAGPVDVDPVENDLGVRAWTDTELAALVDRLRRPEGLDIADRRYLLTTYPRCFVGRALVDWLVRVDRLTRDEAVTCGQLLVDRGLMHHVLDEHTFKDGTFYYRFYADEGRTGVNSTRDGAGA